ncbi:MAG: hypothetical protein PHQ56_07450 [Dysgonamonadaceae bacterium]|jgi:hypothetical protein|nr:hypothetical protein [Dysgonamonadaceae bacterium]MDD3357302.1 hypothetical protein [Dysgonamonadaceae bacterium]MDD3727048.1 hypothetical protein [Dysgonamonadaceae bacterium]MDD4605782.1 hypothetical protein [Dysgonamonadaceae bacterium]HUI32927.1 hypothetical protein [Dysgonamonadaceae bacterium]
MKTYKLTPLDQLVLEEKQLREEIKVAEQKMVFQLQYLNDNWGSMLLKGITSSIKNKLTETVGQISPVSNSSYVTRAIGGGWGNLFLSNYKLVGSLGWSILKPIALTFLTKRATSMLFRRKKKR